MKRKSLLFLLLFALLAPWAANAQSQLNEGFENTTFPPEDWASIHVSGANYWARYTSYKHSGEASAYAHWATSGHENYLITPKLAPASDESLSFYVAAQSYSGTTLYVKVSTTTADASAFSTTLATYTTGSSGTIGTTSPSTWVEKTIDLSDYVGQQIFIAFHVVDNNGGDVIIDDVTGVTLYVASCAKPTGLAVNNGVATWNAGTASQWNLKYKKVSDETWISVNGLTAASYTFSGLDAATDYEVQVQTDCGGGDLSDWTNSASFITPCEEITSFPWTEDFTGLTAGIPICWDNSEGTTTYASYKWSYYNAGHDAAPCLRFNSYSNSSGNTNFLKTPVLNFPANKEMQLVFWWKNPTGGDFSVFISTDGGSTYTTALATALTRQSSWTKEEIDLTDYIGSQNVVIVFKGTSNYGSGDAYIYLDDVAVREKPNCLAPTALAADASTTSAELSWTANSNETAWTVYYKKTTDETYTEVANATNPYTLNGLTAATNYQYYVVANCSSTDASEPSEVFTFTTLCEAITTYPWTENFDSYTAASGFLPVCWDRINTGTSYNTYPYVYGYGANSTSNCLYFYSWGSSSTTTISDQYAILPPMENLAGKQITLFAKGYNNQSTFTIGTMTDPTDVTTFTAIATQELTTSYQEFIYLVPAEATANHIAIKMERPNATSSAARGVYIDDITIDLPPACPKPTDLAVVENSVTAHTVQLSWVSEATSWEICLNGDEEHPIPANTNPFTLTGLTEATTYTAKVRAVCDGTPSEWSSSTVSFTTPIACPAPTNLAYSGTTGSQTTLNWSGTSDSYDVLYRTAAYAEGFYEQFNTSGTPSGWTLYSGLVDEVIAGTSPLAAATYGWNTNTYALGTYNMKVNVYGTSCKYWLVTPEFNLSQNLSFDLALTNFGNADPIEYPNAQADDRFVVLIYADNAWTILREWNNTGSADVYNTIATTGEHVDINLSAYFGKTVKIAFYCESTVGQSGTEDNDLHIDNVLCGILHEAGEWQTAAEGVTGTTYTLTGLNPETDYEAKVLSNCEGETGHETIISFTTEAACMVPNEVEVASVTSNTAVLSWTSSSTAWQIQVNEDEPIDVTENPYSLEGLTPATTYTVKVRANCDGTYTDWSNAVIFTTECEVIAAEGYSENFDSYEVASNYTAPSVRVLPNCWSAINTTTYSSYKQLPSIYYYSSTNYANTTPNCLKFYSAYSSYSNYDPQPQYAILPEMTGLAGMQVTLKARGYNTSSTFKIGTMSDPTDASTFTMIVEQTGLTTSYQEFEYLIPADCQNSYLAIMIDAATSSRTYNAAYIDDIVISTPPTCLKPTDLEVTATTTTSATFSWTNGAADQTAWQICLNGDEENLIMADSNPFIVEGLTASTNYTAKVRAYCGENDQSGWSNEVSFATECEAITTFPWMVDFESFDNNTIPTCWDNSASSSTTLSSSPHYIWGVYDYNGNKMIRMENYWVQTGTALINSPVIELPSEGEYKLTFDYAHNATCGAFAVKVSTDNGTTFTELASYTKGSGTSHTEPGDFTPATISLADYAGESIILQFFANANYGSGAIFVDNVTVSASAPSTVTQTLELTAGWNWVSTYIDTDQVDGMAMLMSALGDNATQIATFDDSAEYFEGDWYWGGDGEHQLTNSNMVMVEVPEDCTVTLEGPALTRTVEITINQGWNWIGFPFDTEMRFSDAMAGFNAENEDTFASSFDSNEYFEGMWYNNFETLVPGQGYMYYYNGTEPQTLVYQIGDSKARRIVATTPGQLKTNR